MYSMQAQEGNLGELTVVGGGLAGCEAAWQAAERGIQVTLYEMRPARMTGAHVSGDLAELVCSNSLGSNLPDRASGLLKDELRRLGSQLLACAESATLPAGGALAVDRQAFAASVTRSLQNHPNIHLVRAEVHTIPEGPVIIASGPLTSPDLAAALARLSGESNLFFYDAIAPIISASSIDMAIAFRASRYRKGVQADGDYINCPLEQAQYENFVQALSLAERIPLKDFELEVENGVRAGLSAFFEGCLPVEVLARRELKALAFGPMRPVGLRDPRTGRRPYAVVQLRQDNLAGDVYNLVGFQTNLTYAEQKKVFRMIPGLETAEFIRYGQMHRNTFMASPRLLNPTLQVRGRDDLFLAGQLIGVEGYMGNIATGLLAGMNAARYLHGMAPIELPGVTLLGALCHYVTQADMRDFQPMKANYGILPPLPADLRMGKRERAQAYRERSLAELDRIIQAEHLVEVKS